MPATEISNIVGQVRDFLVEKKARFWSDDELRAILGLGAKDLWGSILDVHGEHYMVVDSTNVSLPSGANQLSGVPNDCFRVLLIEPRDTTTAGSAYRLNFVPRKYNHRDFIAARTRSAIDPGVSTVIFYHVSGVGAPIDPPIIYTAPLLSADVALRLVYCPTLDIVDQNPIPGESDNALKAWTIAYALGKEGPQGARVPDPGWLGIYSTEKLHLLTRITPRQEQEPEVVDDLFEGFGG